MRQDALVGLGSNLGVQGMAPVEVVSAAARALARFGPVRLSGLWDSPAWPDPSAPRYVNAVASLGTSLPPEALLAGLLAIEAGFGRRREGRDRYAPRTLDLDLLAVGAETRQTTTLTLPHPRLEERDFVLAPLAEIAPEWRHPITSLGAQAMLARLPARAAVPLGPLTMPTSGVR